MASGSTLPQLPVPKLVNDKLLTSWNSLQGKAIKILQDLIKIDTQNFGEDSGNETEAAQYLKNIFDSVCIVGVCFYVILYILYVIPMETEIGCSVFLL